MIKSLRNITIGLYLGIKRIWRKGYMACIFYNKKDLNLLAENELAFAVYDKYPVNLGHVLIIPKRHFKNFLMPRRKRLLLFIK